MTTQSSAPTSVRPDPDPGSGVDRAGGIAAHTVAGTYVVGILAMAVYLVPQGFTDAADDAAASLEFLSGHSVVMYVWYLVLYLVGGMALPVLVLAMHARLRAAAPAAVNLATTLGVIWSGLLLGSGMVALVGQRAVLDLAGTDHTAAVTSWHAISVVQDGLGGGIELVGAAWLLLVCSVGWRSHTLPTPLSALGVLLGAAGLLTLIPPTAEAGASLFGIGLIVWFTWTAHTLLRSAHRPTGPADRRSPATTPSSA